MKEMGRLLLVLGEFSFLNWLGTVMRCLEQGFRYLIFDLMMSTKFFLKMALDN